MRRPACYRERHQASPSLDPRQRRHTDAGSTLWPWCFDQAAVRGTSKSAVNDYLDRRFYHLRLEWGGHRGTTRQYVARTDPSLRAVGCAWESTISTCSNSADGTAPLNRNPWNSSQPKRRKISN